MLLSLRSDHKEHLSLLFKQTPQVIVDFCKLAIDFLQNGPSLVLYNTASEKLKVLPEDVQNCIYGLVNLLLESCKHKLNEVDFRDSVLTVGFTQEQQIILSKFYLSKRQEISEVLSKVDVNELHYHHLNWRFEVQLASRSLLHQVTPLITMELILKNQNDEIKLDSPDKNVRETEDQTSEKEILLQTDPSTLCHITEVLEKALNESRSRHSRRIQKAFNN